MGSSDAPISVGPVLAFGGTSEQQLASLGDNVERTLQINGGLRSSRVLSEKVVHSTQKIPVEIRTTTTKTTRTYYEDDSSKKTVEIQ